MINARKQNTYQNSPPTCKFCGTQGHTLANCPDMKLMYQQSKDLPIEDRSYKQNYAIQYIDRRNFKKTNSKTGVSNKKCGYCREKGHTRRNCPTMVADKQLIIKSNKVWKRVWRDNAKKYGLTPASLIKVIDRQYNYNSGGYEATEFLCTVGAELPENLNVFALGDDTKQQSIVVPLLGYNPAYGNNRVNARLIVKALDEQLSSHLFAHSYSYGSVSSLSPLSPSSYEFPVGWIDEPPTEDIDFALKKWSQEQMSDFLKRCKNLIHRYGGDYGIA